MNGLALQADWSRLLANAFSQPYYAALQEFVARERELYGVFPPASHVFEAFRLTSYLATKVVILGQDPYHGPGQAHGLAFSVPPGCALPPSLKNILKELHNDLGIVIPSHGCLRAWSQQGVLLLNTVLTVRSGQPNSHQKHGWEIFTDSAIELMNAKDEPVVFVLWGSFARKKRDLISRSHHHIIESAHPSPLSAHNGFFGTKPFSRVNEALRSTGQLEIDWRLA